MEPKVVKTRLAEYTWAEFSGKNESGMYPYGDRVLIMPDQAAKTSSGLILFTEEQIDRNAEAAETGVIVAVGPEAFMWNSDRTRRWESADKPKVGDHVVFDRYSGSYQHGRDDKMYRLMDDKCVGALAMDEMREAAIMPAAPAATVIKIPVAEPSPTAQAPATPAPTAKTNTPRDTADSNVNVLSLSYTVADALDQSPTAAKNIRANPSTIGSFVDVVFDKAKGTFPKDSIEREIREQLAGLSVKG